MERLYIKRGILIILIVINCLIIFCFSSQKAEESSNTSSKIVDAIVDIVCRNKTISNQEKQIIKENSTTLVRKGAHFSIYTCLGILTFLYISTYQINLKKRLLYTILFCIAYACSDEFHQIFVEGRSGEIRDVCIDTCGALFGTASVIATSKFVNFIKKK